MVTFSVAGIPAPQGSKKPFRRGSKIVLVEMSKKVGPWREAVAEAAQRAHDGVLPPPYRVEFEFFIPRPKTTKATHPVAPSIGDLDKIVRATNDTLTISGLIVDDRYVTKIVTSKEWAGFDGPGALIRVESIT